MIFFIYVCTFKLSVKMTVEQKIEYWVEISDEDLKVAKTMMKNHHHLYTCFMCHQAIEKIFKASYEKLKNETPPYIHDLPRLALAAGFYDLFSDEQKLFLNTLNPLNIEARYPEYKDEIAAELTTETCAGLIAGTDELLCWINEQL